MNIRQLMSLLKILEDVISALIWWGIYSTIAPHRKNKMDCVKKKNFSTWLGAWPERICFLCL